MVKLILSTIKIFFTLLTGQDWLGQQLMQQKKYLKSAKFLASADFPDNFKGVFLAKKIFLLVFFF